MAPASTRARTVADEPRSRSRSSAKRICLFGLFGMDNYGNDGSLEAMLLFLREAWPDAKLSCVCIDPDKVEAAFNVPSVPIRWHRISSRTLRLVDRCALTLPQKLGSWVQAISHMRNFDVLIVPGTSLISDYRAGPLGSPYSLFRWAVAAWLCGKKLYFVSTGAGPIKRRPSRWMLTCVARLASYWSFRDHNSRDFVANLGIDTRKHGVYPDLAFKLKIPTLPTITPSEAYPITIAVGLMDYNGWHGHAQPDESIYEVYLSKLIRFTGNLLDRKFRVRLLVGEIADERVAMDLLTALASREYQCAVDAQLGAGSGQIVIEPVHSLDDIMRQLADTSIVVATRFHNIVCALKLGRPTISISYHLKSDALLAEFGLGKFCQHIEHFDEANLLAQVEEQLANKSLYEDGIQRTLQEFRMRLAQQEKELAQIL